MVKTIVIYESNTGFTKKYAEWISKELHCECVPAKSVTMQKLKEYDQIIFGSWMHAGKIMKLKKYQNVIPQEKKVAYFATGATPVKFADTKKIVKTNQIDTAKTPFYYYQSGLNYENMNALTRFKMLIFRKFIAPKKDPSGRTAKACKKSSDYCRKEDIQELVAWTAK